MSPESQHASTRASALALLADGNSLESVSHVLGVDVDVLDGWRHVGDALDTPQAAARPPAAARQVEFEAELVYQRPLWARVALCAMGLFMAAAMVAMWHAGRDPMRAVSGRGTIVIIAIGVLGVMTPLVLSTVRWRFVFGRHGVSERGAIRTSPILRYADIEKATIARDTQYVGRGARAKGYRIAFVSAANVAEPMTLFTDESLAMDEAIVDRLLRMPGLSMDDLAPLRALPVRSRRPVGKVIGTALVTAMLVLGVKIASFPWQAFRQILHGQPSLEQLTHVRGDLRRFTGCGRDPLFPGRGVDATLRLDDGRTAHAWIPCVMPRGVFADQRSHVLSVDSWQDGGAPPLAYQVKLDGLTLLPYDAVREQRAGNLWLFALLELLMATLWLGLVVVVARLLDDRCWADED